MTLRVGGWETVGGRETGRLGCFEYGMMRVRDKGQQRLSLNAMWPKKEKKHVANFMYPTATNAPDAANAPEAS